eukprot:757076-Hanusia_phi.AAC.8
MMARVKPSVTAVTEQSQCCNDGQALKLSVIEHVAAVLSVLAARPGPGPGQWPGSTTGRPAA